MRLLFLLYLTTFSSILPALFTQSQYTFMFDAKECQPMGTVRVDPFFEESVSRFLLALGNDSELLIEMIKNTDDRKRSEFLKTMLLVEIEKVRKFLALRDEIANTYGPLLDSSDEWSQLARTELERAEAIAHERIEQGIQSTEK